MIKKDESFQIYVQLANGCQLFCNRNSYISLIVPKIPKKWVFIILDWTNKKIFSVSSPNTCQKLEFCNSTQKNLKMFRKIGNILKNWLKNWLSDVMKHKRCLALFLIKSAKSALLRKYQVLNSTESQLKQPWFLLIIPESGLINAEWLWETSTRARWPLICHYLFTSDAAIMKKKLQVNEWEGKNIEKI